MRLWWLVFVVLICGHFVLSAQELSRIDDFFPLGDSLLPNHFGQSDSAVHAAHGTVQRLEFSIDSLESLSSAEINKINSLLDSVRSLTDPTSVVLDSVVGWQKQQISKLRSHIDSVKTTLESKINALNAPESDALMAKLNSVAGGTASSSMSRFPLPTPSLTAKVSSALDQPTSIIDIPSVKAIGLGDKLGYGGVNTNAVNEGVESISSNSVERLSQIANVDGVKGEIANAAEAETTVSKLADENATRSMLQKEFQKQAIDHFTGKGAQIQLAMSRLSKYKKKYDSPVKLSEVPSKRPNPMRGLPLRQRLLPGISFQVNRHDAWLVDINPYIGYWMTGHIVIGLGWNHRIGYDRLLKTFVNRLSVFGPRTYAEYAVGKGFSGRLETEFAKVVVPTTFSSGRVDTKGREWVFGSLIGIKKTFRIVNRINGTAMVMYNIYNPEHRSPYQDRLIVRVGIEVKENNNKK